MTGGQLDGPDTHMLPLRPSAKGYQDNCQLEGLHAHMMPLRSPSEHCIHQMATSTLLDIACLVTINTNMMSPTLAQHLPAECFY